MLTFKLLTLLVTLLSLVKQTQAAEVLNFRKFCWGKCKKAGPCPQYCGTKGVCCRGYRADPKTGCYSWSAAKYWAFTCSKPVVPGPNGILNANKECWRRCGRKDGPCKGFCGTGLCCRKGRRVGACNGFFGGNRRHVCIQSNLKAPPTPAPTKLNKLQNIEKECWRACRKPGQCNFCGSEGYCCRSGTAKRDGRGCVKGMGGQWVYQCSKKMTPAPTRSWPKNEWKIPCPAYNAIPRPPLKKGVSYKKLVCDMLRIVNNARRNWKPALKPYCLNSKLMRAARIESYACVQCGKMNHIPWNVGCRYYLPAFGGHAKRIQRCGYKYGGGVAEILAGGPTAQIAYNMWYREYTSSGKTNNHYGAIVNPGRSQVGIAAEGRNGGLDGMIWTIVTARPRKWGEKEKCDMKNWCNEPGEGWAPKTTAASEGASSVTGTDETEEGEDETEIHAESQEINEGADAPLP